jgi:arylsulfatase
MAGRNPTSDKNRYVNFCAGRRNRAWHGFSLAGCCLALLSAPAQATPPSVVFILLDTTRADRLSAWGGPNPTTPHLDALAASWVRFAAHFANAHATRPSMPQLMTGRYYHQNVLRAFRPVDQPREFPFNVPDPTSVLLPAVMRAAGFQTLAVSSHPWVARESQFGEAFETFDLLEAAPERGHAGAAEVVDRGLALWAARDQTRPTFLYLHFMDAHMPRFLPESEPRFPVPGYDWRTRFRPDGEPAFDRARRTWSRFDASDFTPDDRRYFAAVYDTLVAYLDEHLGRLIAALRREDPSLSRTVVLVVADHGEELGDDGRVDHGDSLADAVQHVPWIMAGAGIAPGRVVTRITENVDVMPTLLSHLHVSLPPGTRVDGRAQLGSDGAPCSGCAKPAAYYAWEDYRGIRRRREMLRVNLDGSVRARCAGAQQAFALDGPSSRRVLPETAAPVPSLRRRLDRRLGPLERRFLATRYGPADRRVLLRTDYWHLDGDPALACSRLDEQTPASGFRVPGWLAGDWGIALLRVDGAEPLHASVDLPDGDYALELATIPIPPVPWLFGFTRWRKKGFETFAPSQFVPLGSARASGGRLAVVVPPDRASGSRILGVRVTPEGVAPTPAAPGPNAEELRRLRALGYVQ